MECWFNFIRLFVLNSNYSIFWLFQKKIKKRFGSIPALPIFWFIIMRSSNQISFKVVLAGDHQSGKTSFMLRLSDPENNQIPLPTVGTEFIYYSTDINGITYKLQLWDTAGHEVYRSITTTYFRSCKGVFLFFDLTQKQTFENLSSWLQTISDNSSDPLVVVIANKNDLQGHEVSHDEISKFCRDRDLPFFLTSAKTGENIQNAICFMISELSKRQIQSPHSECIEINTEKEKKNDCC